MKIDGNSVLSGVSIHAIFISGFISGYLQRAAVTLAELGEYTRVVSLLENLTKEKPSDPDVFRLLGEVKHKLKDYEGSANAYESAAKVSKYLSFEVLRGRANALLAAKKPDELSKSTHNKDKCTMDDELKDGASFIVYFLCILL
ncbi:uncharacterized protein LOC133779784 [Humulus lupulus]|uniref:uncharacterized protein LOC133779784 n=1 Tax=Humulus lupulus TaxID=3486 RepID=UPI002B4147D9|nr:uncharacterized protein LOC133779784 [Humulus lupulus]